MVKIEGWKVENRNFRFITLRNYEIISDIYYRKERGFMITTRSTVVLDLFGGTFISGRGTLGIPAWLRTSAVSVRNSVSPARSFLETTIGKPRYRGNPAVYV